MPLILGTHGRGPTIQGVNDPYPPVKTWEWTQDRTAFLADGQWDANSDGVPGASKWNSSIPGADDTFVGPGSLAASPREAGPVRPPSPAAADPDPLWLPPMAGALDPMATLFAQPPPEHKGDPSLPGPVTGFPETQGPYVLDLNQLQQKAKSGSLRQRFKYKRMLETAKLLKDPNSPYGGVDLTLEPDKLTYLEFNCAASAALQINPRLMRACEDLDKEFHKQLAPHRNAIRQQIFRSKLEADWLREGGDNASRFKKLRLMSRAANHTRRATESPQNYVNAKNDAWLASVKKVYQLADVRQLEEVDPKQAPAPARAQLEQLLAQRKDAILVTQNVWRLKTFAVISVNGREKVVDIYNEAGSPIGTVSTPMVTPRLGSPKREPPQGSAQGAGPKSAGPPNAGGAKRPCERDETGLVSPPELHLPEDGRIF